jgi:hypothetical protein
MLARYGRITSLVTGALAFAAACAPAGHSANHAPPTSGYGAEVRQGLARVRSVTAPFVSLDSAVAAGYAREVARCFDHPQHGAMGFHHLNRGYVDARVEVERPEILLYERRGDGTYSLNGVEYIIPFTRWPRDSVPPKLFGLDLKREEDLKLWYLHMWAWTTNSAGLFADYNPAVKCPDGSR